MDLRQIEQMVELRRCGGVTAAARRLGISQPSLSRSLARLESSLGCKLFDRNATGVQLTPVGELLCDRGIALLGSAASLHREVELMAQGYHGRLRIGFGPATRLKPLPEVIRRLVATFPNLSIEARQVSGAALPRAVMRGRYDVAFSFAANVEPFGDLIRIRLFDDRQSIVAVPNHPLTLLAKPTLTDALRYPVAGFGTHLGLDLDAIAVDPMARANLDAFVSDDAEAIRRFPLDGHAIARAPRFVFEDLLAAKTLVEIGIRSDQRYECWMVTSVAQVHSPLLQAVARIAREACAM